MCSQWWTCCGSRGGQWDRSNTVQLRFLGDEEEEGGEEEEEEEEGGGEGGGERGVGGGAEVIGGDLEENYALQFQSVDMKSRRNAKVSFS